MNPIAANKLKCGLYVIHWYDGEKSLGCVGMSANGDRWLACSNWCDFSKCTWLWQSVEKVELITSDIDYLNHSEIRAYATLCNTDIASDMDCFSHPLIRKLSETLEENNFHFLAKAVRGGVAWIRKIRNNESLKDLNTQASSPEWSWNRNQKKEDP